MNYIILIIKFIFLYLVFIYLNHINPKKISNYTLFDYIETSLIILISFYTIINVDYSLFKGIIFILFVLIFNYLIRYIYLINPKIRYYLDNKIVIVSDGKINFKEIIKNRYILDELIIKLKEENISEINNIKKAYFINENIVIITK
ncbi:putative uncharacterized protein [Mycoplasma sp. CAG:611]|nr:putative uncharacterized protein [Mycoplasma sp. CAG:611]